ncbi:YceI family protein [Jiangella asiatica]|uniref:Polyisoprenoid-binding protein n=1 Tax=Jiangella asiatica TaxID=2530372 RepID=A0A4R5CF72_9ACTN|nr:YceI family protein [Jiangella asiatica]TDD98235.1 polyisoprenoid-binding protein [Jiangella asiatica]
MSEAKAVRKVHPWNGLTIPAPGTFTLDPAHANVGFVATQLKVVTVRGRFEDVTATLHLGQDPTASSVEVVVKTASLSTGQSDRDALLRSDHFFDVENHPELTFRSTGIQHVTGNEFTLDGHLTIRDRSNPVRFAASFDGVGFDPWGAQVIGLSASTEINRQQWGLTWHGVLETGGVLIGKKVTLEIDAEFNRRP